MSREAISAQTTVQIEGLICFEDVLLQLWDFPREFFFDMYVFLSPWERTQSLILAIPGTQGLNIVFCLSVTEEQNSFGRNCNSKRTRKQGEIDSVYLVSWACGWNMTERANKHLSSGEYFWMTPGQSLNQCAASSTATPNSDNYSRTKNVDLSLANY